MFWTFFRFELRFWLRGMMVYVFMAIIGLLIFGAVSSDNVRVGDDVANGFRNAPYMVQLYYAIASIFSMLMTTAFVNGAALRDFNYGTQEILFTKPLNRWGYLAGRFLGASIVSVIPILGVSLGILAGSAMPWNEPQFWGPNSWQPHLASILMFAVPNTFITASIIFAVSLWLRSTMAAFVSCIVMLIGLSVSEVLLSNLDNEMIGVMLDPLGTQMFDTATKYWTVSDRNTMTLWPVGLVLANRLIWISVGAVILGVTCSRFSLTAAARGRKRRREEEQLTKLPQRPAKVNFQLEGIGPAITKVASQFRLDFFSTIKSGVFIIIMAVALLNTVIGLLLSSTAGFGLSTLPVTYSMIDVIRGGMYMFLIALIVYYSGVMVWKEREAHLNEVYDALPHPTWISYLGKLLSLLLIVFIFQAIGIAAGILVQAASGYSRFQIELYATELFVWDYAQLAGVCVLALLAQVLSPNKYFGYFALVTLLVINNFAWGLLDVESLMFRYGSIPTYTYSDLYKFAPFQTAMLWFTLYWLLFAALLCIVSILFWQRGRENRYVHRLREAFRRVEGGVRWVGLATFVCWIGVGSWIYFNTMVQNTWEASEQVKTRQANYEKTFKDYSQAKHPRVVRVKHNVEIYPAERRLVFQADQTIENRTAADISELFVQLANDYTTELEIDRASLVEEYPDSNVQIYKLEPALQPGESIEMSYTVSYSPNGFENSVSVQQILQNGTFFNNGIAPQLGYQPSLELQNRRDRKRFGLGDPMPMPTLDPANMEVRGNHYISNNSDWVDVETIISTSSDQIAIAPGSLLRRWEEDGRNYFHYKVDHPSLNFYSFISARYKVAVQRWNGIDIEVYYHPDHEWNVDNMLRSIRRSLEYFSENFGPYRHKQARIIEFPRVASFAQAFPGTMPYSEGIGFIADLKNKDDIDMVYYVVAHEMAHQWWAHQVIGANMEGATLLSETLAQYSALMVMEREFGRDMMRKFLEYEMDNYLRSRGQEALAESPLMTVRANQGYVHYRKGSVVMYYLKEMIGEDKVNQALREVVDQFAYQGPPYPTSVDLVDALRERTPAELEYLIDDLFTQITLFANRTVSTSYKETDDNRYEVTLTVECHKYRADEEGEEREVQLNDWIEIGAFADPEPGRKYGETLYRERVQMQQNEQTFTFVVDEVPDLVGVDPFMLLIDRQPKDNVKRPSRL